MYNGTKVCANVRVCVHAYVCVSVCARLESAPIDVSLRLAYIFASVPSKHPDIQKAPAGDAKRKQFPKRGRKTQFRQIMFAGNGVGKHISGKSIPIKGSNAGLKGQALADTQ